MNFSIPGLTEAASEISAGLERLSESVRTHRIQAPETKEQFAYHMMLSMASSGASSERMLGLRDDIDLLWEHLRMTRQ